MTTAGEGDPPSPNGTGQIFVKRLFFISLGLGKRAVGVGRVLLHAWHSRWAAQKTRLCYAVSFLCPGIPTMLGFSLPPPSVANFEAFE